MAVYQPGGKSSSGMGVHHIATLCLRRSARARVGVAVADVFPFSIRRKRFHAAWVSAHVYEGAWGFGGTLGLCFLLLDSVTGASSTGVWCWSRFERGWRRA